MSFIVPLVLVVLAIFLVVNVIKIVPQGREFTVERFGRYTRTLKPGISFLTPFVESAGGRRRLRRRRGPFGRGGLGRGGFRGRRLGGRRGGSGQQADGGEG